MQKKALVVLSICMILGVSQVQAQKIKRPINPVGVFTGEVPSAFSHVAPVSFVRANVLGRKVVAAQVALQNMSYLSSANLFARVKGNLGSLPAKEVRALELKFVQLDLAARTATNQRLGYLGALWNTAPAVEAATLSNPYVQQMTQLLDIQRYMQQTDNMFPHVFSIAQGGWLMSTTCLISSEGNRAFLNVVELLVKEQLGQADAVVIEQLVALHAIAQNAVPVAQVVDQLKSWRMGANDPTGAPKLPMDASGVSLRANAEDLWLAVEIRLLQLTPDIELPEILKTAPVTH